MWMGAAFMVVPLCLEYCNLTYNLAHLHDVATACQVQCNLLVVSFYSYACHAYSGEVVYLQDLAVGIGDVCLVVLDGEGYGLHFRLNGFVHLHVCNGGNRSEEKHGECYNPDSFHSTFYEFTNAKVEFLFYISKFFSQIMSIFSPSWAKITFVNTFFASFSILSSSLMRAE